MNIPEGYVLVPVEPTTVQVNAGADADDLRTGFETVKHIYRAMLAAVPPMDKEPVDRRFKCTVCGKPIDALMEWMKDGKMVHKECAIVPPMDKAEGVKVGSYPSCNRADKRCHNFDACRVKGACQFKPEPRDEREAEPVAWMATHPSEMHVRGEVFIGRQKPTNHPVSWYDVKWTPLFLRPAGPSREVGEVADFLGVLLKSFASHRHSDGNGPALTFNFTKAEDCKVAFDAWGACKNALAAQLRGGGK